MSESPDSASRTFRQEPDKYASAPRRKDYYDLFYGRFEQYRIGSVLDVGTASGDFLFHMPQSIKGVGIDRSAELIAIAKDSRSRPNLSFHCTDILTYQPEERFDCITVLGTLVTFLDFRPLLLACLALRPHLIMINDFFNADGVDIQLGYREAGHEGPYQYGYNIASIASVSRFLDGQGVTYQFEDYQMTTRLAKDLNNPVHSHHARFEHETVLTNGTGLILRGYNLTITPRT